MTQELTTIDNAGAMNRAQPAAAYLASLGTTVSRAGMESADQQVARIPGRPGLAPGDWGQLNAANVQAIISKGRGGRRGAGDRSTQTAGGVARRGESSLAAYA